MRFTALTASRQVEVRRATWEQFGLEAAVWVKPAEATKTAKPHRVPLSRQALAVLAEARKGNRGALVFPGTRSGAMMGNVVMTQALRNAGIAASGHGFRSSFKGWARQHDVDELLSEFALAHVEGFLAAGHTVAEDSGAVNDEEGPLVTREGLDDVAGGGDEPGAAVGAVVDEARAGTIGRLEADDLRCDLGDTLGPVRHFRRTGADVSGGRVRVIDAPVRPGRGSSRPEESTEWRRQWWRQRPGVRRGCCRRLR